ncbi:MAG TPA: hypothetical protein VG318_14480 [Actinomycetota bacterium]|nr:hypothetical protein [Actinomycetota bacterium]
MSVAIPTMKRKTWPLYAAALSVVALGVLSVLLPQRVTVGGGRGAAGNRTIPQAAWEVRTYPAPGASGITRKEKEAFQRERDDVVDRIQGLYEALFLKPGEVDRVVRSSLSRDASKALAKSRLGLHDVAEDVQTTKRFVKVGIQVDGGRRAAAVVLVEARAVREAKPIRVWHRAKLWLEKSEAGWKVVAFDAEQGRLK